MCVNLRLFDETSGGSCVACLEDKNEIVKSYDMI